MNKQLFKEVTDWQEATFKTIDMLGLVNHLADEVEELKTDVINRSPYRRLEFANCFILLMGAAKADGMSYEDICNAIKDKLEINKQRTWGEPDSNGVINHLKEEDLVCCANCVKMWNVFEKTSAGHVVKSRCTLNPAHPVSIQSPHTHSCTNYKSR